MSATETTTIPEVVPSNHWTAFGRYGLPGLVIAVLFFFMWTDRNAAREDAKATATVIADNTRVMVKMESALADLREAFKECAK